MKVLVVTNMYPTAQMPAFGTFVRDQVKALRAAGAEVDVFFINGRQSTWNYLWGLFRFWRFLSGRRYDIIHAHYVLAGVIARAQWGHKVVLTHHGPEVLGYPRWQALLCRLVTPFFDHVIYVSEEIRRALNDKDGSVVPCGINLEEIAPLPRAAARKSLHLSAEQPLVLWAGEYWRPEKCFSLVSRAMAEVKMAMPDAELVVVSKQPHRVVPQYMSACDVLVLTSLAEGSPMVIKEAMACNLPIVSVRVGDVAEVIGDTPGCAIAERDASDIAAKLLAVLQQPRRTNGRSQIDYLRQDRIARRLLDVYAQTAPLMGRVRSPCMAARKTVAVCIVRHDYYPDGHVSRDAETLAEAGYDVSVIALRRADQPVRDRLNDVAIYRLPVEHHRGSVLRYAWEYLSFFVLALVTITLLHARKRFRIVEVDNMPDALVFVALVPKLTGARVILYIFDNMPELLVVARGYRPTHPLVRLLARAEVTSASFADQVIVTQEFARRVAQRRGVPDDKIAIVLNCPDERSFDRLLPRDFSPDDRTFHIVTHGSILERYGIQVMVDAMPGILKEIPEAHLQVFGEGEYRHDLEMRARRNGVAEQVCFGGRVPLEDLVTALRRSDVGYVGMLCDLMLSNKLMEYAALDIPVVGARWPTYEYYFPDDAVTYFPPGDARALAAAILAIYRDRATARRKAERARALYEGYRWAVQRGDYLAVYEKLVRSAMTRSMSASPQMAPQ